MSTDHLADIAPITNAREQGAPPPVPSGQLYSVAQIVVGSAVGSLLVGGVFMAINFGRLGRSRAAVWAVVGSLLVVGGLLGVGFLLPANTGATGLLVVQILAVRFIAVWLQGPAIDRHRKAGGQLVSWWIAMGLAVQFLVLIGLIILATVWLTKPSLGTPVQFGDNDTVYISGQATQAEAKVLADALKEIDLFGKRGGDAALHRGPEGTDISIVLAEARFATITGSFELQQLANELANWRFGHPLRIHLCDQYMETLKTLTAQPLTEPPSLPSLPARPIRAKRRPGSA